MNHRVGQDSPTTVADSLSQIASSQSISGTGALHLAALLLRASSEYAGEKLPKVYIPEPTWSNHHQVFAAAGFDCIAFPYYDAQSKTLDWQLYRQTLSSIEPESIVILHACAQNPTGIDPSKDQWREIGQLLKTRKIFPIVDAAYLGFNSGNVDEDAFAIRHIVNDLSMDAAVCVSFAKNMGLYGKHPFPTRKGHDQTNLGTGERIGCTMVATSSEDITLNIQSVLERLQRSEISNPPAFGAKIASTILSNEELKKMWFDDLITMSSRIRDMRHALFDRLVKNGMSCHVPLIQLTKSKDAPGDWSHIVKQTGMFAILGLSSDTVLRLKGRSPPYMQQLKAQLTSHADQFHVYMASNSRISIAGLNTKNVDYVAESIKECLRA